MITLLLVYFMNNPFYPADLLQLQRAVDASVPADARPVIGISTNFKEGLSCIHDDYVRAITRAGGVPLLLPVMQDIDALQAIVAHLDGLLLSGGADVNPLYSGEEPIPALGMVDPERDRYELILARLAANRQVPLLGICRGHQLINVAFGGKNYQDIPSQVPGALKHGQEMTTGHGSHTVRVAPNSTLFAILGKETVTVNSYHHQAIKEIAPGLTVTATAPDGVIEAMEALPDYRVLGVQWHPERVPLHDSQEMEKIFRYFTREALLFKRAKEIHERVLVIDSHCDTPMKFSPGFDIGKRHETVKVDLPKMREGLLDAVCMVAYLPQGKRDDLSSAQATATAMSIFDQIEQQVRLYPDAIAIARDPADARRLKSEGKKCIFLAIENGYAIGKDLANLARFKEKGVAYITLCHNGSNDICDPAEGAPEHGGLSDFGREVVREMNRLGIIIDISHAGEETFRDVIALSRHPVIASHSSVRALRDHPRNLTDEQIRALAANGGVVQVCLYNHFLAKRGKATLRDAIDHVDHVTRLVGIDHVGIGTDFDGDDDQVLPGCRAANELPNITVELLRRGYTPADIEKLWGGNLLRVMTRVQQK
ncbi:MAG: gamma-glutamyl-gamma-aminobutyrate hydrolase family protein [Odoribacteraceae bacterium]|jgi:microsomal dipeptidase-like Zn-dependent dipeptidase/gamma-glutamyl-gamma-aminobutyrate hydrolase PuuD|nr:gamma-glutamyl-gamma-aminobutyrate hydrolase family protein [Odoribacteraceae bacterium]